MAPDAARRGHRDRARAAGGAGGQPLARLERVGLLRHAAQPLGAGLPAVCRRVVFPQRGGRVDGKCPAPVGGAVCAPAGEVIFCWVD